MTFSSGREVAQPSNRHGGSGGGASSGSGGGPYRQHVSKSLAVTT